MTKQSALLLFFAVYAAVALTQNCVGSLSDDLIQTGTLDVFNPGAGGRETLAQTPVLYTIPSWGFQSTFSFIDLQYNTSQGMDFTIRGGRINSTNFLGISLLLLQDRRWDKIRISYLVNSRKDIWTGSFIYSPYNLNSGQNNSGSLSTEIYGCVKGWEVDNSNQVFLKAVFLSGLQTGVSNFSLVLNNVTFDKVRGIVGVTLSNSSKGIDLVTISYVIFISPNNRFAFDSFNYPGSIPVSDYGMIGSSGFLASGISGARYYGINIESNLVNCYGSLCNSTCVTKANCSLAAGIQSNNDCFICPNNTKYNDTLKVCVAVPPVLTCGANQQINNGACECVFGYIKLGQVCVSRCGVNQEWSGSACICSKGTANITNVCRSCPPGSTANANRTSCDCGLGSIFDEISLRCVGFYQCQENSTGVIEAGVYRCKCNADFFVSGQTCVYCPAPAIWSTSSLTCSCPNAYQYFNGKSCISCGPEQFFNSSSKQCECFSPRVFISGECKCPNNLIWNNQTNRCECPNKFEAPNSLNNCVCTSPYIRLETKECGLVCPENEWWNAGECKCKTPFVRINGKCTINCPTNEKWNTIQCVCVDGFFRINGTCATCTIGMFYNATSKACQNLCGINEVTNGSQCVCKDNFYRINSVCSQCPAGTGYRPSLQTCIGCDQNEIQLNSICVCRKNFYRVNGVCGLCPLGTIYNQDKQTCDLLCPGANEIYDGKNCVCALNFYRINGICSQCASGTYYNSLTITCDIICKANQVFDGANCVCSNGFNRINGVCGQCPAGTTYNRATQVCDYNCKINEVFDGTTCVCIAGLNRINGVCGMCPTGTTYNRNTQVCDLSCRVNEIFDGTNCVCAAGLNRISGICGQCPAGTIYNRINQLCESICKANEIFDGVTCVCAAGLNRINGVCGQCPAGTTYNRVTQVCDFNCKINEVFDGTTCVCANGFNRINGICGQCPAGTTYNRNTQVCDLNCRVNEVFINGVCICAQSFVRINGVCSQCGVGTVYNSVTLICDPICKTNEVFDGVKCVCASGFFVINGFCDRCPSGTYFEEYLKRCVAQPTCPLGAEWNQAKLQCQCKAIDQYLINGNCQSCGTNAGWNGTQCVCRSGFFLIGTECLTCDINSSYNATLKACVCNRGFYGDRTSCLKCNPTCGRCSGPDSNQCLDCVDVSFTLVNGVCSKPSSCVAGMYLSGTVCKTCSAYCSTCKDENTCTECTAGFMISSVNLTPTLTYSMCEEICGDGKRFEYACDDGNTNNNDGCNNQCEIESGWSCSGGTTTSKSVCMQLIPTRSVITPKGAVQSSGKVMQGVTLSYLPDALTANGCPKCSEVLMVSIIQAQVIPSFRVNFLPTTQFKYLIEFDFQGIFGIPPFTFTLRVNPDYAKYFSTEDMAQLITVRIDPAVLARGEQVQDLTLDQIMGTKIAIADGDLKKVFN